MIRILHIDLVQFRNYPSKSFDFNERIITICGSNGMGKTNLLDALYFLSFTKSYFNKPDAISSIKSNTGFSITGKVDVLKSTEEISIVYRENGKKELLVDKVIIPRFSDHIGKIPMIFVAPDDIKLITGGSEERRNFIDTLLSQLDHDYLSHLIKYNKVLLERNKLLKNFENIPFDEDLLEAMDQQLFLHGGHILQKRIAFTHDMFPIVKDIFNQLSDQDENPQISFMQNTTLENYLIDLKKARPKDLLLQRTSVGIHKDEIEIEMNDLPFKQIASQGQKKSMLFALKLASFEMLKSKNGFEPVLLLDDIFEKLDAFRLEKLMDWVCKKNKGQVFMTDTHPDRMSEIVQDLSLPFQTIKL